MVTFSDCNHFCFLVFFVFASDPVHLLCGRLQSVGGRRDGDGGHSPAAEDSEDSTSHQASIRNGEVSSELVATGSTCCAACQ